MKFAMNKKNKARILAVGASGALLVTGLTACSENSALTFYTSLQAASEITNYNYATSITGAIKSDAGGEGSDVSFGLDCNGTVVDEGDMKAVIALKASLDGKGFDKVTLTDVYVVDDVVYINIKALLDAVPKMAVIAGDAITQEDLDSLPALTESMGITADYVTVDLKKIDTASITGDEATPDINDIDTEKLRDSSQMAFVKLTTSLENALKDVKPQVVGTDKDKYTLTVSNENFAAICDALVVYIQNDFVNTLNDIANTAEQNGDAEFAKEVRDSIPSAEDIASAVEEINSMKESSAEAGQFKLDCWTKFAGNAKKNNRKFDSSVSMGISADGTTGNFSVLSNISEISSDSVITPPSAENCWSADDLIAGELGGMSSYDDTFGIDTYSDFESDDWGSSTEDIVSETNNTSVSSAQTSSDGSYVASDYDDFEF